MTDEELARLEDLLCDFGYDDESSLCGRVIDFVNAMLAEREKK